ncbi:hypothetical protein Hypma_009555 [Hypsizygus marmoreus]|uniref:Uncharacterized protein n=1 Tax=Hypsizygus marmoreus TaxID=39966 RepID=A0A369JLP7_HYPMA|nr:hypothetical protein Hypma_009555 [Hypsizygus marmoreus]
MISTRLLATTLARTARPAIHAPCRHRISRFQRSFSASPRAHAVENPAAFMATFQKTSVFKKLANHPEAIAALENFAKTLQDAGQSSHTHDDRKISTESDSTGIDLTSGKKPSTLKMAKLAMSSKFREEMKRVADEMNKAGVDFTSKEVMDEIMTLQKAVETPK